MGRKVLKGLKETITWNEAMEMAKAATDELLGYLCGLVDEATEDEDERANAKVLFAQMVGKVSNAYHLAGMLCDPQDWISSTFPEGTEDQATLEEEE